MVLDRLAIARLHFELETLEEAEVPAYKGDLLRMALLWWLSEYWCPLPQRCRHGCRRPEVCMFGRLCEPPVDPAWSPQMKGLMGDTPPPAYVLWDMQDRRRYLAAGTGWSFELTLVGELAVRQIPAIAAAVQQGAEAGMGRVRLRSRVLRVTTPPRTGLDEAARCLAEQRPKSAGAWDVTEQVAGDSPSAVGPEPGTELTWQSFRLEDVAMGYAQAVQWADRYPVPVRALNVRYLSPVKIKEHKEWVAEPHFGAVMKALVRRLRLLSQVHGAGEWPHAEWGPLLDLAETVRLEHGETLWTGYTRRSKTSGVQEIEGFVGQAWYAGEDLRPLLPALWLGQWLHIGKGYVLGNGRYVLEQLR
jgi:hypothetical protein